MELAPAIWILLIGAIILSSSIVEDAAQRLHLPGIVAYLALGWLLRLADSRWGVLGEAGRSAFGLLADLGIVALLFRVGLHSHLERLIAKLRPAALVWLGDVVFSGTAGFLAARYVAQLPLAASLIVGTALTATSIGVATAAWSSANALDSPDGDLMLDVAELDDLSAVLLMAIVFAVVPALAQRDGLLEPLVATGGAFALKFLIFASLCYLFARYLEAPLSRFAATRRRAPQRMLTVAGAALVIAGLAGWLGFSLAIGALFAGLLFSRDPRAVRTEAGFDGLHDFLIPFFFVGIGLETELASADGPWLVGGVLLLAAVAGKVVGAGLPALLVTSRAGALVIGVSMIARAEIALVVAYQGLARGLIERDAYAAIVLVSAGTCVIAPWLIGALIARRGRP
jgi:Kef-type K+ transport system membrane component KefB